MAELIRRYDWATTPLGPRENWPQSLRTALAMILHSKFPTYMVWGPDLISFYNDAYRPVLGSKSEGLGRPFRELWPEAWDVVGPIAHKALAGEASYFEDLPLTLERTGYPERTWWTFSYSPIHDESGQVGGVLCTVHETTAKVQTERRLEFLVRLSDRLRTLSEPIEVIEAAQEELGRQLGVSRVGYGEVDATCRFFTTERNWTDGTVAPHIGTHDLAAFGPEVHDALRRGDTLAIEDVSTDPRTSTATSRAAFAFLETAAAATLSLVKGGRMVASLYVHNRTPRRWSDNDLKLMEDVAERTWDALERARSEAALRASEERFRDLIEQAPKKMWVSRRDGSVEFFNAAWRSYTGQPLAPEGLSWAEAVHPEDRERLKQVRSRGLAAGERYDIELRLRRAQDGAYRWHLGTVAPLRNAAGEIVEWAGIASDIDDVRRAEQALRELNGALEARVAERTADRDRMWRLSTDIMLVARFDATIAAVNPAWTTLLGWSEGDLIGRPFLDLVHPDDLESTRQEAGRLAQGQTTLRFENRYRAKDGSYRWLSWIAVPDEDLIHAVGRDVTAEKAAAADLAEAQEQLRQSQKMEAVGQLTGGIAHDFNNLLTAVTGYLDIARRSLAAGDEARAHRAIGSAMKGADSAAALTHRLLAFARRQPLAPRSVDVGALLDGMSDLLLRALGEMVRLRLKAPVGLPAVFVDANQLEAAILNLAVNGRDAMPDGGELMITAAPDNITPSQARRLEITPGAYVSLSVTDSGTGMDPAVLSRVFEPFFTTKPQGKGTGLGLAQVYGFARQSGGAVEIDSAVGRGTTVRLLFPASEAQVMLDGPGAGGTSAAGERRGSETILLVEDQPDVAELAEALLTDAGYRVLRASSGDEALALLGEASIDLLFSDVVMPGSTDGMSLAREARVRRPGLPVLLTTGYAPDALSRHELGEAGVAVLNKPYRRPDLLAKIRDALDAMASQT
ncbi:PAS domain S-box protein [Rubellimicrobium arenae]|uniref:PAS domain S-box protein n=1 Tax=Rubellimicrobium arenae TaxID=2817372 RepID=UPI001B30C3D5